MKEKEHKNANIHKIRPNAQWTLNVHIEQIVKRVIYMKCLFSTVFVLFCVKPICGAKIEIKMRKCNASTMTDR